MKQMPEEGRKFGIVDQNWRDMMGKAVSTYGELSLFLVHFNFVHPLSEFCVLLLGRSISAIPALAAWSFLGSRNTMARFVRQ